MDRKAVIKTATRLVIVATLAIFVVSAYNLGAFFSSIISPQAGLGLKLVEDQTKGGYVLGFGSKPTNKGFLSVDLVATMTVFDGDGQQVGYNSTAVSIPPGASKFSNITVIIPASLIPGGDINAVKGSVQIEINIRTLWNLVGFRNVIGAGGG